MENTNSELNNNPQHFDKNNPNRIDIGDKVFKSGNIGEVIDIALKNDKLLQFWVLWNDSFVPMPELASLLQKVNSSNLELKNLQNNNMKDETLCHLASLVIDENLQQRIKLDLDVVDDYAHKYSNNVELPPITIWHCTDDNLIYLVDGFHRVKAALMLGKTELSCVKKSGSYREAILYSVSVNSNHGLRRTNADKRKAVLTLLFDSEWNQWSDNQIARQCFVSQPFVSKLRQEFFSLDTDNLNLTYNVISDFSSSSDVIQRKYITKQGSESIMNITNIGTKTNQKQDSDNLADSSDDIQNSEKELNNPLLKGKTEIKKKVKVISEGINYKAGEGCRWYVEITQENYDLLLKLKEKLGKITFDGVISHLLSNLL